MKELIEFADEKAKTIARETMKKISFNISEPKSIDDFLFKPSIYIYYNKNSNSITYIGETMNRVKRAKQHKKANKINKSDNLLVFESDLFHKSAIYDIESRLISLAISSGHHPLLKNSKIKQTDYNYFTKDFYKDIPKRIWDELGKEQWGDSKASISKSKYEEIINGELYKLSPYKLLTKEQEKHVNDIIDNIMQDRRVLDVGGSTSSNNMKPTLVIGGPGTGKSIMLSRIVSQLYEAFTEEEEMEEFIEGKYDVNIKKRSNRKIIVSSGSSRIRKAFDDMFKKIGLSNMVEVLAEQTIHERMRSKSIAKDTIVLIDEAHNFKHKVVDKYGRQNVIGIAKVINNFLKEGESSCEKILGYFKNTIFFADPYQKTLKDSANHFFDYFESNKATTKTIKLVNQMRSAAVWIDFIDYILLDNHEPIISYFSEEDEKFFNFKYLDCPSLVAEMKSKVSKNRIICSSYSFEWSSDKNNAITSDFDDIGISAIWKPVHKMNNNGVWQRKETPFGEWLKTEEAYNFKEVAYYDTVQGFEVEHIGLIIGDDLKIKDGKITVDNNFVCGDMKREAPNRPISLEDKTGFDKWKKIQAFSTTGVGVKGILEPKNKYIYDKFEKDREIDEERYDDEMKELIINRYRVLLSRATESIDIFIKNKDTREWFEQKWIEYKEKVRGN